MAWISKKRLTALELAAAPYDGTAPWLAKVDGNWDLIWPDGARFVPITRELLTSLIADANGAHR